MIEIIEELIDYIESSTIKNTVPTLLKSLIDSTNATDAGVFMRLLLAWLYYNGRYQKNGQLEKREEDITFALDNSLIDMFHNGLKYVPILRNIFVLNENTRTFSHADSMSYDNRLSLERYVYENHIIYIPHTRLRNPFNP